MYDWEMLIVACHHVWLRGVNSDPSPCATERCSHGWQMLIAACPCVWQMLIMAYPHGQLKLRDVNSELSPCMTNVNSSLSPCMTAVLIVACPHLLLRDVNSDLSPCMTAVLIAASPHVLLRDVNSDLSPCMTDMLIATCPHVWQRDVNSDLSPTYDSCVNSGLSPCAIEREGVLVRAVSATNGHRWRLIATLCCVSSAASSPSVTVTMSRVVLSDSDVLPGLMINYV